MEPVEIAPEPEPDEREAILAALAEAEHPRIGVWGRPELGEDDDRYGCVTARRRKSEGAPRA